MVIATLSESSGGIHQLNEASTQNYEFLADDPLIDRQLSINQNLLNQRQAERYQVMGEKLGILFALRETLGDLHSLE